MCCGAYHRSSKGVSTARMELSSLIGLISVFVLVLANGFFVATEFAIVAVRRSRLEQMAEEGVANARAATEVVSHLDSYIAACQLGITMASLALGWIGEPAFAHLIEPPLEAVVGRFAPAAAHTVAVGTAFAIITALHIVIGELAPKGLAIQLPESTTLWISRPIKLFYVIFKWPITILNAIGNGMLKLFGLQPASGHEMVHSVEEMRYLVTGMQQAGVVETTEARIAKRAFRFADVTAGAVMTPRTEIEAIPLDINLKQLLARIASGAHTRVLVYEESLDDIVGALHVHDLFKVMNHPAEKFQLQNLLRPVLSVPESKTADDLLEEMQASRRQLAVVIDEYGGTAGIVTIENLLEVLVGPIEDEPALGSEGLDPVDSLPEADGSLRLDGLTRLQDFEEITGLELDEASLDGVETVGGMVMTVLGRVPDVGDELEVAGRTLRVEELDGLRVAVVRLLAPQQGCVGGGPSSEERDGDSSAPRAAAASENHEHHRA